MLKNKHLVLVSYAFFLSLLAVLWPQSVSTSYGYTDVTQGRVLIINHNEQDYATLKQTFNQADIKINHQFPPHAFIITVPTDVSLEAEIASFDVSVFQQAINLYTTPDWPDAAMQAALVWNTIQFPSDDLEARFHSLEGDDFHRDYVDSFEAPPPAVEHRSSASPLPSYAETSQFLMGSIAVGVVLPESNGLVDPSSENWDSEEIARVISEIAVGMEWWASLDSRANLTFVYDNPSGATVPTGYEPITRDHSDQRYWIEEAMTAMGHDGTNYFDQVRSYNDHLRDKYQTDWAFTIFVVDSSADIDNTFANHYFAYAYLGGPFMVMTYGNQNYGIANMDAVAAHEMGHIFRALDQYGAANQACSKRAGYLSVENQNSQASAECSSNSSSIMRGQIFPFINKEIDHFAQGQVGWWDADNNGVLDPVDVDLVVSNVTVDPNDQVNILTIKADLEEVPYQSPSYRSVIINKLKKVEFRLNDGAWQSATATDGTFDLYEEAVSMTTEPLASGSYDIYVRATDNFGKVNEQFLTTVQVEDPLANSLNTTYDTALSMSEGVIQGETVTVSGQATNTAGGTISSVQYRINDEAWQVASASDGQFDDSTEVFEFTIDTATMGQGTHTIQVRAIDHNGMIESSPDIETLLIQSAVTNHQLYLPAIMR
ncbi:MAG: Ig-like domain-containing protein [Chloroflexota bacterium]